MSDHETFCSTCASLSFTQMLTWEGQVYHENWRALEASATRGCRLCDYFRTEKDNVDNCPNLYSGTHGPLVLRIAYTDSLQLFVRSDVSRPNTLLPWSAVHIPVGLPESEITFRRRIQQRGSQTATDKIRAWVHECETKHSMCLKPSLLEMPIRILDLSPSEGSADIRLVDGDGLEAAYIALSHCWGKMSSDIDGLLFKCTTSNIATLYRGISLQSLPPLYRDAVTVTRNLGIGYLWLDSICILQNSKDDWAIQCSRMAEIYANSYLTISAVSCQNSLESFWSAAVEPPYCEFTAIPGLSEEHTLVRKNLPAANRPVPLLQRAWAVQERFLSSRVLHFTADDMVFECNYHTVAEGGWFTNDAFNPAKNASIKRQNLWNDVIEHFSQTDITYDTDRLPALSGIAKTFLQQQTGDEYIAGLWKNNLAAGLLWQTSGQIAKRPSTYIAPTWSWASMNCAVWGPERPFQTKMKVTVLDFRTQPSTANPLGEISSASLTVQGPFRSLIGCETLPEIGSLAPDQFYRIRFRLVKDRVDVRLKFDTMQSDDLAGALDNDRNLLLVCTLASALDTGWMSIKKTAASLQPHGLVLRRVSDLEPPLYERVGVFQVKFVTILENAGWDTIGFVESTVTIV